MWGGAGSSNDTLTGGNGTDMFWFGKNDGADYVTNAAENDSINLYDISLADINFDALNISSAGFSIGITTGGNLNVTNSSSMSATFILNDGSRWKYNRNSSSWQSA